MKKINLFITVMVLFIVVLLSGCTANNTSNQNVQSDSLLESSLEEGDQENCLIKGNISSSGEKIYHVPGGQYYDVTVITESKGERWFCSEQEAINAGWRKSKR